MLHLKRVSGFIEGHGVDAFSLRLVFENMLKRLQVKLKQIKDICKSLDLESALANHPKLVLFALEVQEIEEAASITGMFTGYSDICGRLDELEVIKGVSWARQHFVLRK